MVVDSSAVLTIVFEEDEAAAFLEAIETSVLRLMSVASLLETSIVLDSRRGSGAADLLDGLIERLGIEIVPVTLAQVRIARAAWRRYGKGNDPAGLNFGDCFAYALAAERSLPLLFKGGDFSRTDLLPAL